MAKEEKTNPSAKPRKKGGGKLKFMMVLIVVAIAMPFMLPTVLLLVAGLAPTYVAFATDSDPEKSGAVSVGAMNIAGLTPFLLDLWMRGQTSANAFRILAEPNNWLIIFGAAAIGQLIIYTVPQAIAALTLGTSESRIKALKKNLELLKDSWGADVASAKPVEKP